MNPIRLIFRLSSQLFLFTPSCRIVFCITILLTGCVVESSSKRTGAINPNVPSFADSDKLRIVDCMLPGRVHKLGAMVVFVSPRRPEKMVAGFCEIRGGEYIAYDRADLSTSLSIWLGEAESGSASAQTYAGEMYEQGLGTVPDYAKAYQWYLKAAEQGYARAQMNLGHMHEKGLGVPTDMMKALSWYRKATGLTSDELQFASASEPLREELRVQTDQNRELQLRLRETEEQLAQRQREMASIRVKKATEPETENASPAILAANTGSLEQQLEIDELRARLKQSEQKLAADQIRLAEQQKQLSRKSSEADANYQKTRAELQAANQKSSDLQAQLADQKNTTRDLKSRLGKLQKELNHKQLTLETAKNELSQTRSDLEKELSKPPNSGNTLELDRLNAAVAIRENQVSQLQQELAQLDNTTDQQQSALNQQLTSAQSEIVQLQEQLDLNSQETADQEVLLAESRVALQSVQMELEDRNRELQTRSEELQQTRAEAKNTQQQLELVLAGNSSRNSAQNAKSEQLDQEIKELKGTVQSLMDQLASTQKKKEPPIPGDLFSPQEFGNYYALIIGNSKYLQLDELPTAIDDAQAVSNVLTTEYGFNTKVLPNANLRTVLAELYYLREQLKENDKLLIYYTGHGYLDQDGNGWWQLVDATTEKSGESWLDDKQIAEQLDMFKAKHILIVADSCYSNQRTTHYDFQPKEPPEQYTNRQILKQWIRRMLKIETRMVLTSGEVRPMVASTQSKNSVFTKAFLESLQKKRPVLEGSRLAYEMYKSISSANTNSGRKGKPSYVSIHPSVHRGGEFFFRRVDESQAYKDSVNSNRKTTLTKASGEPGRSRQPVPGPDFRLNLAKAHNSL